MKVLKCRRSVVGLVGIVCLFVLGMTHAIDPCAHIVSIVVAIAGANAAQGILERKSGT